jgi:hypothetical protein
MAIRKSSLSALVSCSMRLPAERLTGRSTCAARSAPPPWEKRLFKKIPSKCDTVYLLMVTALTLLQLAFLFLGTITLKGMINARGNITSSLYFQFLAEHWLWFFLIPVVWNVYALISNQINKGPFTRSVTGVVGAFLAGICFIYFASVFFFPRR